MLPGWWIPALEAKERGANLERQGRGFPRLAQAARSGARKVGGCLDALKSEANLSVEGRNLLFCFWGSVRSLTD